MRIDILQIRGYNNNQRGKTFSRGISSVFLLHSLNGLYLAIVHIDRGIIAAVQLNQKKTRRKN